MRTELEIQLMRDALKRFMDVAEKQMQTLTHDPEAFDQIAGVFNHNSGMVSVLDWVLGADTLKHEVLG